MKNIASQFRSVLLSFIVLSAALISECSSSSFKFPPAYSFRSTKNNVDLKISTKKYNANVFHLLQKSRLLRKYNVIELECTNNNDTPLELHANAMTQNIHSLPVIKSRVQVLDGWQKLWLYSYYAISGFFFLLGITQQWHHTERFTDSTGNKYYHIENKKNEILSAAITGLISCGIVSIYDAISKSHKRTRMQDLLAEKILEPNDIVVIAPHSTVNRFLFCPRETFNPNFSISFVNQRTSESIVFNPIANKYA